MKTFTDEIPKITFVIPSRNNLDLLKLAYKSIRRLKGEHEILVLDDASIDGTGKWLSTIKDENLITQQNLDYCCNCWADLDTSLCNLNHHH